MERLSGDHFHIPEGTSPSPMLKHRYSEAELKKILDEREAADSEIQMLFEAKSSIERWIG